MVKAQPVSDFAKFKLAPLAAAAMLLAAPARADWKITPAAEVRETYTDNVALAADGLARAQWVTEINPSLVIANHGPRLELAADYRQHIYRYSDDQAPGTNRSSREFRGDMKAKLIEDALFLDASGSVAPQALSAFGQQLTTSDFASANRAEVRSFSVAPYVTHRFGDNANLQLRYTRDRVEADNPAFGSSNSNRLAFSLASGAAFRQFGWGVNLNRQELNDRVSKNAISDMGVLDLRYRIVPTLALTASGGYDRFDFQSQGGSTAGKSWSVGATWNPSLRTSVQATTGRKFYGSSQSLAINHRSRYTVWSVNYSDGVTTSRDQFLLPAAVDTAAMLDRLFVPRYPDPAERQRAVAAYIAATGLPTSLADSVNYLSNRYILQKQFQASVALNTAKTNTVFSIFDTRRNALSVQQSDSALLGPNLLNLNDATRQQGASATLIFNLSSRSAFLASDTYSRVDSLATGIATTNRMLRATLTRQLKPKMKAGVEVRRVSGPAANVTSSYRENAVAASLSMQL